jgi:hypothetical protein
MGSYGSLGRPGSAPLCVRNVFVNLITLCFITKYLFVFLFSSPLAARARVHSRDGLGSLADMYTNWKKREMRDLWAPRWVQLFSVLGFGATNR